MYSNTSYYYCKMSGFKTIAIAQYVHVVRTVLCLECGNYLWWLAVYSICSLRTYIVYLVQLITNNLHFITVSLPKIMSIKAHFEQYFSQIF